MKKTLKQRRGIHDTMTYSVLVHYNYYHYMLLLDDESLKCSITIQYHTHSIYFFCKNATVKNSIQLNGEFIKSANGTNFNICRARTLFSSNTT